MPIGYKTLFKLIVVLFFVIILKQATAIIFPLIIALIITFILNPFVDYLCGIRWGKNFYMARGMAVIISFVCSLVLISCLAYFVLLPFAGEFDRFVVDLPALLARVETIKSAIQERAVGVWLPGNINKIVEQVLASATAFSVELTQKIVYAILSFTSKIVELVVVPVLTYYFLKDWRELKETGVDLFSQQWRDKVRSIIEDIALVVSQYIRGQVLVSIVMGLMVFSGMYFLRVDYPMVLGLIATITETIPIIGPIIGAIPAIMLAYLMNSELAVKVIVFYLVVHQLENHIIIPKIMGHTVAVHPTVIIISLLIGAQLWGIWGMMLAVPLVAILRVLFKHLW